MHQRRRRNEDDQEGKAREEEEERARGEEGASAKQGGEMMRRKELAPEEVQEEAARRRKERTVKPCSATNTTTAYCAYFWLPCAALAAPWIDAVWHSHGRKLNVYYCNCTTVILFLIDGKLTFFVISILILIIFSGKKLRSGEAWDGFGCASH